jgi:RNA polymerase sigma factor (sigma-70 family)
MPTPRTPSKRLAVLEDDHLLQQASTGDQRAFERLVERHGPWLLHLICRIVRDEHLAHDILQQVWLQLYRSLPTLRAEGTLQAWLARVGHNRCLDELRRTRLFTFS